MTEDTRGSSHPSEPLEASAGPVHGGSWWEPLQGRSIRRLLREPRVLCLLALASILLLYRDLLGYDPTVTVRLQSDEEGALFEPVGGSPHLMFAVVLWILWRRRHHFEAALAAPEGGRLGSLLLLPAIASGAWSVYVGAPDLLIVSLMLFLIGSAFLLAGAAGGRSMLLPALLLLLILDPAQALEGAHRQRIVRSPERRTLRPCLLVVVDRGIYVVECVVNSAQADEHENPRRVSAGYGSLREFR